MFDDGSLEVFWDGKGYGVRRMSDGTRVIAESYTTEPQAIAALQKSYAKVA
ncbi:MAG: hypothetical protein GY789_21670 [Hyphomicrobiales bacterium]|nr:hypothetical protein [Hyphomicrobiales bacterium]